jgi:hypothetical protein
MILAGGTRFSTMVISRGGELNPHLNQVRIPGSHQPLAFSPGKSTTSADS